MRFPGVTKGSWRTGDELASRKAKPEPERVMELELPHRIRMVALRAMIYYVFGES